MEDINIKKWALPSESLERLFIALNKNKLRKENI